MLYSVHLVEYNCSLSSSSSDLIDIIAANTICGQAQSGRVLRPKGHELVVFHIKGINIPRIDKWGTNHLGAFVTQLITRGGYYNENKEWIGLEKIKIVISLNQNKGKLEQRLAAAVQLLAIEELDENDVVQISSAIWKSAVQGDVFEVAEQSAKCMKKMQTELPLSRCLFYNFNLQHIADWANSVGHYKSNDIWSVWKFEAERIFRDRLITQQDRGTFDMIFSDRNSDLYFPEKGIGSISPIAFEELSEKLKDLGESFSREVADIPSGGIVTSHELTLNITSVTCQLSTLGGNIVIIGAPGAGRKTAVQLRVKKTIVFHSYFSEKCKHFLNFIKSSKKIGEFLNFPGFSKSFQDVHQFSFIS